ncbi:hypothetical protein I4U23_018398 [Adineta vaga]|nr:hypothetical protein I4U23_018398 [Adineta vaga]
MDNEKPNLRPTKRSNAHGKSLYLHYNPNQPENDSYIYEIKNNIEFQQKEPLSEKRNPFSTHQPNLIYSLNKHQRWELLNDLRQSIANQSSSSSDNDSSTQSSCQRQRKTKKSVRKDANQHQAKYCLYECHSVRNDKLQANCIEITTNLKEQRTQIPRKTYMQQSNNNVDVTYIAVVPPPREKFLNNIRRSYGSKNRKITLGVQCHKFDQMEGKLDAVEQFDNDEDEELSTDDDDDESYYTVSKDDKFQLNDFIAKRAMSHIPKNSSKSKENKSIDSEENNSVKSTKKIFYRQFSKDEGLSKKPSRKPRETKESKENSSYIMSFSFRTIYLHRSDLAVEYLSKTYGKDFIHAQCYPTKYMICLTDRLRTLQWTNNFKNFPAHTSLNCYLIIILNENIDREENHCQGQVALNMDLNVEKIEITNLSLSIDSIYHMEKLINETLEFIMKLSNQIFKPIDSEINQRKLKKNETDNELSDSEFINKQIRQVKILDQPKFSSVDFNNNIIADDYDLIRPEICTNCYAEMNESTPMTALKSCGHWLCNQCWKQYLENSIQQVKVILCPEWNCCSMVDVGTMLSLVNIRCLNIYERNIEKCLVNLSRSYVTCPIKSCSNIVQIIGARIDQIRCRCGHQFCIHCKQELHFPATCSSYQAYIEEANRNGDLLLKFDTKCLVRGRNCVSCNNFIEKSGGCNHMTCRCGAEFCWLCTAYWKDHYKSGSFHCPKPEIHLQKKVIIRERNCLRKLYEYAILHRFERKYENQAKQFEHCKRLVGTIPFDQPPNEFDSSFIKTQVDKREALLRHCYQMVKYINYLHRICEFVAVAADGYGNNPIEFANSFSPLETVLFNLSQILESGRGYKAIEQLNHLHQTSERIIERIRQVRQRNSNGYMTS